LTEILFTNGRRQAFAKLPILKLSLHNSAAFVFGKSFADIRLKM